jgi:hypothetical protein
MEVPWAMVAMVGGGRRGRKKAQRKLLNSIARELAS